MLANIRDAPREGADEMTLAMWTPSEVMTLLGFIAAMYVGTILPGILVYKRGLAKLREEFKDAKQENKTAIEEQNKTLDHQTNKLEKIGTDVNGGKEKEIAHIREGYEKTITEMRVAGHKLESMINAANLRADLEAADAKALREQIAELKEQAAKQAEIARTLATRAAMPAPQSPPEGLGNAGQT